VSRAMENRSSARWRIRSSTGAQPASGEGSAEMGRERTTPSENTVNLNYSQFPRTRCAEKIADFIREIIRDSQKKRPGRSAKRICKGREGAWKHKDEKSHY